MEMGMRLKSFRRGPLAAEEGSGSGRSASALAERPSSMPDARCQTPCAWAQDDRLTEPLADGTNGGQGLSAAPGQQRKGRAWLNGPFEADHPVTPSFKSPR